MPSRSPPSIRYPNALDDDYTLFKVYNTTQSVITEDNPAWSEEISIRPKKAMDPEVWATNGFATINGELLYYDSVELNDNNKVDTLIDCVRNLGGSGTGYAVANTDIYGFVIAEHHNQLVDAIIAIEELLGTVCQGEDALICCLQEIQEAPSCGETGQCANLNFNYQVVSTDTCSGTTISYTVNVTGTFDQFLIDFGDGTTTNIAVSGTKTYAPGSVIDPTVTVANSFCTLTQTGVQRTVSTPPTTITTTQPLTIPVPTCNIPTISVPSCTTPSVDVILPPLVLPPISLSIPSIGPISIETPSIPIDIAIQSIPPINVNVNLTGGGGGISLTGSIPSQISLIGSVPSMISVSCCSLGVDWGSVPTISVSWGSPPTLSCVVSVACPGGSSMMYGAARTGLDSMNPMLDVNYESLGIPDEITIAPPIIPPIELRHTLPSSIEVISPNIPSEIVVTGLKNIELLVPEKMPSIYLDATGLPESIPIEWGNIPKIQIEALDIPYVSLKYEGPSIITVQGMVDVITVKGIPDYIPLRIENPEVKISLSADTLLSGGEGTGPCFRLVPCA